MRTFTWLGATLAATIGFAAILSPAAQAVRLSDGRVYFERLLAWSIRAQLGTVPLPTTPLTTSR